MKYFLTLGLMLLSGCTSVPEGISPVDNFQVQRYLGTWYELARIENSFERDMHSVTANYQLRQEGGIMVTNSGYLGDAKNPKVAEGKAYFVSEPDIGHLKVSFFGPFYGAYVVFELDHEHYNYAFVTSNDRDYLWLLSRSPVLSDELKQKFIDRINALGFSQEKLIFVEQRMVNTP